MHQLAVLMDDLELQRKQHLENELAKRNCVRMMASDTDKIRLAVDRLSGDAVMQYSHMFMWRTGSGATRGKVWPILLLASQNHDYDDPVEARHTLEPLLMRPGCHAVHLAGADSWPGTRWPCPAVSADRWSR